MEFSQLFNIDILQWMNTYMEDELTDVLLAAASQDYECSVNSTLDPAHSDSFNGGQARTSSPSHQSHLHASATSTLSDNGPAPTSSVLQPTLPPAHPQQHSSPLSGTKQRFATPKTNQEIENERQQGIPLTQQDTKYCIQKLLRCFISQKAQ